MNYFFILTILIVGASGIVAQVIILRELLVSFYGNELTLGIILANWVMFEAAGAFIAGKYIDKTKNKINIFVILQIIFSFTLPLTIYFSRVFKNILGIPFGQAIGLDVIFFSSLVMIFPVAFCHGALFSTIISLPMPNLVIPSTRSLGKVYSWETMGTILGGIILTYLFLPYLNSFQIALIIYVANIVILFVVFKKIRSRILKFLCLSAAGLVIYLSLTGSINYIHRDSVNKQWKHGKILDYRNSIYGNVVATKEEEQLTFFYNGLPIITTPYPDIAFVEEFGHLPLLFHSAPRDILIVSGGAGGLINEVLKHDIRKIDYVELDPLIINMLKEYSSSLTTSELSDKRVNIVNVDGRFFLRTVKNRYDVVLVGMSCPADLSTNRFFTRDFFSLVKKKLNPEGILAFRLPGTLTYMSPELRDLNACVLNALKDIYNYVRVIPGDYNMFFASSSKGILDIDSGTLVKKINRHNIKTNILGADYLAYRLSKERLSWFNGSLANATKKTNLDLTPFAVFEMLLFWNKQFSPWLLNILGPLGNLNLKIVSLLIFGITVLFFCIFYYKPGLAKLNVAYSIATTGFFGMLVNLILIFSFQVFYGYLYRSIGMLIAVFMAGIALGSIFMTARLESIKNRLKFFILLEAVMAVFAYCLALAITRLATYLYNLPLLFMAICFIPGVLVGAAFPLAAKMYSKEKERIAQTAGILYCSDLIGGWIAGIFASIVFLPILGLFKTCMVIVMLKLSSLLLLISTKDKISISDFKS